MYNIKDLDNYEKKIEKKEIIYSESNLYNDQNV